MVDYTKIKGTTFDWKKFNDLKQTHWRIVHGQNYRCDLHKTIFNIHSEPCWQCYESCVKEV